MSLQLSNFSIRLNVDYPLYIFCVGSPKEPVQSRNLSIDAGVLRDILEETSPRSPKLKKGQ